MTIYAVKPSYPSLSPDDAFKLAQSILPESGFVIWKERPLGWLIMANKQTNQGVINVTLSFRPGVDTMMNLSLSSDHHNEKTLKQAASRFIALFENQLDTEMDT